MPDLFRVLGGGCLTVVFCLWLSRLLTRRRFSLRHKHVCITGGSQGIGLALAHECLRRGASEITLIARVSLKLERAVASLHRTSETHSTSACRINAFSCDVTDPNAIAMLFALLNDGTPLPQTTSVTAVGSTPLAPSQRPIDVLVTCAGTCICDHIDRLTADDLRAQIDLNLLGTLYPCQQFARTCSDPRPSRVIVLVGSMASQLSLFSFVAYGATKFGIRGVWEALSMECIPLNLRVMCAFPPNTDTPGFTVENLRKPKIAAAIEGTAATLTAEEVAKKFADEIENGGKRITFGILGRAVAAVTSGFDPATDLVEFLGDFVLFFVAKLLVGVLSVYWSFMIRSHAVQQKKTQPL